MDSKGSFTISCERFGCAILASNLFPSCFLACGSLYDLQPTFQRHSNSRTASTNFSLSMILHVLARAKRRASMMIRQKKSRESREKRRPSDWSDAASLTIDYNWSLLQHFVTVLASVKMLRNLQIDDS